MKIYFVEAEFSEREFLSRNSQSMSCILSPASRQSKETPKSSRLSFTRESTALFSIGIPL